MIIMQIAVQQASIVLNDVNSLNNFVTQILFKFFKLPQFKLLVVLIIFTG